MLVVEGRDGRLWIDSQAGPDLEIAVKRLPLPGRKERIIENLTRGLDGAIFGCLGVGDKLLGVPMELALSALGQVFQPLVR